MPALNTPALRGWITYAATTASLGLLLGLAPSVQAQEGEAQQADRRAAGIEAITVTAQKRETLLQETPIAVSAFTSDDLDALTLTESKNLADFSPGITMSRATSTPNQLALFGRGLGNADNNPIVPSKVGVYIDGMYIPTGNSSMFELLDVERVEVLRGPQGTLFGRNTIGGAVNVVSRKPQPEFGYRIRGELGQYQHRGVNLMLNVPLVGEEMLARFSYSQKRQDPVYRNLDGANGDPWNDNDSIAARAALRWLATDDLTIDYSFDWSQVEDHGNLFKVFTDCASACLAGALPPTGVFPPGGPSFAAQAGKERPDSGMFGDEDRKNHVLTWQHSLNASWNVSENLEIRSISGWRKYRWRGANDLDGSNVIGFHSGQSIVHRTFLQELQLVGTMLDGKLDYVIGSNWFNETSSSENYSDFGIDFGFGGFGSQATLTEGKNHALAGFGQATFWLTDRLSLTGGIRYTTERKQAAYDLCQNDVTRPATLDGRKFANCIQGWPLFGGFGGNTPFLVSDAATLAALQANAPPGLSGVPQNGNRHKRFSGWSPMARIQYEWTDEVLTYLSWARGFNSGGFNPRPGGATPALLTLTSEAYENESLFSWEAGLKSRWLDNRLQLNVAGYYNETEDQQETTFVPGGGTTTAVQNAGKSRIRGVEIEATAVPLDGLTLFLTYAWTKADFSEFISVDPVTTLPVNVADTRKFRHIPKRTASGYVQYVFPSTSFGTLIVNGTFNRESPKNWLGTTAQDLTTKSSHYTKYGTRVSLVDAFGMEGLTLAVVGTNITDREYLCCQGIDFSLWQGIGYGDRRKWIFQATYEYGGGI